MAQGPMVVLKDVSFSWPSTTRPVLSVQSLHIHVGERVFLQGASGSGKTTLLGIIGGVLVPNSGTVQVNGAELKGLSGMARDSFRANHIGFIFQMFNLLPYLSVRENVMLPCRFSFDRKKRAAQRHSLEAEAARLLESLGLGRALHTRDVTALSVGQQQRVAVARALMGSPELIIADEPTSALDADAREAFMKLLFQECLKAGSTLLFVSHDPHLSQGFDRTLRMAEINQAMEGN